MDASMVPQALQPYITLIHFHGPYGTTSSSNRVSSLKCAHLHTHAFANMTSDFFGYPSVTWDGWKLAVLANSEMFMPSLIKTKISTRFY